MIKQFTIADFPFYRSKAFLDFVRNQPCIVCGDRAEPHHAFGKVIGKKGSDLFCVPLCRGHHNEIERLGLKGFEEKHPVCVMTASLTVMGRYIINLENSLNGGNENDYD